MTRHERLVEAYEDAYFALLMEEVAEMEGAEWEERLKELENDPEAVVPEEVNRKCIQTIERCFAKKKREEGLRVAGKVLNRVAVFLAIISMMFTTVLAVSEDARVATANLLITINERYAEFHMDSDRTHDKFGDVPTDEILDSYYFSKIQIGWLPEGFSFVGGTPDVNMELEDKKGTFISINYASGHSSYKIDTENVDNIDYIEILGQEVIKIEKGNTINMVLINEKENCFVGILFSDEISSDIAAKIMENISFL